MAKICPQCNLKHHNVADRCFNCGSDLEIIKRDVIIKRTIIISIIVIIVSLSTLIALNVSSLPETKLMNIVQALNTNDTEGMLKGFPDFVKDYWEDANTLENAYFEERVESFSNYLYSFNVFKVAVPSTSQKTDIRTSLAEFTDYGYDSEKLEDIRSIWIEMRVGTIRGFWSTIYEKFVMIKYDGVWYWWPY